MENTRNQLFLSSAYSDSPTADHEPDRPVARYVAALGQVSRDRSTQQDYQSLRRKALSEAVMYGDVMWPKCSKFIRGVRNMMYEYRDMKIEEFYKDIKDLAEECKDYCDQAERLKNQHVVIIRSLNTLKKTKGEIVKTLAKDANETMRVSKQQKNKARVLKGVTIASCMTLVFAVVALFSHKYGAEARKIANEKESIASELQTAIEAVDDVEELVESMGKLFQFFADYLNHTNTELHRVDRQLSHANRPAKRGDLEALELCLNRIRSVESEMVTECDNFLREQVSFEVAMAEIREEEPVNTRFRIDWTERVGD